MKYAGECGWDRRDCQCHFNGEKFDENTYNVGLYISYGNGRVLRESSTILYEECALATRQDPTGA